MGIHHQQKQPSPSSNDGNNNNNGKIKLANSAGQHRITKNGTSSATKKNKKAIKSQLTCILFSLLFLVITTAILHTRSIQKNTNDNRSGLSYGVTESSYFSDMPITVGGFYDTNNISSNTLSSSSSSSSFKKNKNIVESVLNDIAASSRLQHQQPIRTPNDIRSGQHQGGKVVDATTVHANMTRPSMPTTHQYIARMKNSNKRHHSKRPLQDIIDDMKAGTIERENAHNQNGTTTTTTSTTTTHEQEHNKIYAGQPYVDFAIIGHAKCGTTTLMYWLQQHPQILIFDEEIDDLQRREPWDFITRMYTDLKEPMLQQEEEHPHTNVSVADTGTTHRYPYKRGYKTALDVENLRSIRLFREYFPKTKLIVGIRHPVYWFQSVYNFRTQNGHLLKPAHELPMSCGRGQFNVCSDRSIYQFNLMKFGKTNQTTEEIDVAFNPKKLSNNRRPLKLYTKDAPSIHYTPNPIFIYEMGQLADFRNNNDDDEQRRNGTSSSTNKENHQQREVQRAKQFRYDLQHFLDLSIELDPPAQRVSPGKQHDNNEKQRQVDSRKIRNICDDQYKQLRQVLVNNGKQFYYWFQNYFQHSPDITISNPDHFDMLLKTYRMDPCDKR